MVYFLVLEARGSTMRFHPVDCNVSIPIYRFTYYSLVPNALRNSTVGSKLIDTMTEKGRYSSILTDAVMQLRSYITYGPRLSDC